MDTNLTRAFILTAAGFLALASRISAQTIPELIQEANHSLGQTVEIETGPPPSVESVLKDAKLIVRGTIGTPISYLSEDKTKVYSDYPIINPVVLFPLAQTTTQRPTPALPATAVTITHIGGTVSVLGHQFTMEHSELPPFRPGTEGVFLLKPVGQKYAIAGTFYGAFQISGDTLAPLTTSSTFATELRGSRVDQAIQSLVAKKQALP
jgi:hypothetical protein